MLPGNTRRACVDDVVGDDGEGDQEKRQLQDLHKDVKESHQYAPPCRCTLVPRVMLVTTAVFDAAAISQSHPGIWVNLVN